MSPVGKKSQEDPHSLGQFARSAMEKHCSQLGGAEGQLTRADSRQRAESLSNEPARVQFGAPDLCHI